MLAPKGSAFLFVRREIQPLVEPLIVSWGFNPTPDFTTGSRFVDFLQWTGTRDPFRGRYLRAKARGERYPKRWGVG